MTTTVKTVTRQYTPRSLADLDPKVAIVALVTVLAWLALIVLYALGKIPVTTLVAGGGPASVATLLGYAKTSSHRGVVFQAEQILADAESVAPAVEAFLPAATPVVEEAEGILSSIGLGEVAPGPQPLTAAVEVAPAVPAPAVATTAALTLSTGGVL